MVDRRLAQPGGIVVGADSHSTTYGGLGCFATGLGSTDIGVVFATGKTWFRIPETVRIDVRGHLPRGVYAKDLALHVIAQMGADGADYCAVEWGGEAVAVAILSDSPDRFHGPLSVAGVDETVSVKVPAATASAWVMVVAGNESADRRSQPAAKAAGTVTSSARIKVVDTGPPLDSVLQGCPPAADI